MQFLRFKSHPWCSRSNANNLPWFAIQVNSTWFYSALLCSTLLYSTSGTWQVDLKTFELLLYCRNMPTRLKSSELLLYRRNTPTGLKDFWTTIRNSEFPYKFSSGYTYRLSKFCHVGVNICEHGMRRVRAIWLDGVDPSWFATAPSQTSQVTSPGAAFPRLSSDSMRMGHGMLIAKARGTHFQVGSQWRPPWNNAEGAEQNDIIGRR